MTPSACRAFGTATTTARRRRRARPAARPSTTSAAAPRATASAMNRRPSAAAPGNGDEQIARARPAASRRAPRRSARPRPTRPRSPPPRRRATVDPRAASPRALAPRRRRHWPCARTPRGRPRPRGAGPGAGRWRSATPVARPSGSSNASSTPLLRAAWIACPRLMPAKSGTDHRARRSARSPAPSAPATSSQLLGQGRIVAQRVVVERQVGGGRLAADRLVGVAPSGGRALRRRLRLASRAAGARLAAGHRLRRRRHVQVAQRLLGDLLEDGRRHRAAQVPALRLVDDHDDGQARIVGRHHAHERRRPTWSDRSGRWRPSAPFRSCRPRRSRRWRPGAPCRPSPSRPA